MKINSQGWKLDFSMDSNYLLIDLFNGRKKKTGKDVSRKRRRYKYKEMESGAHSKSNLIIPTPIAFALIKNKY